MNNKNMKVKFTTPIIYDKPSSNGVIVTKEAVEKAMNELETNLPIIVNDRVIGITTGTSHITTWDYENQVCRLTVDGIIFNIEGCFECKADVENGIVNDFRIISFGIIKENDNYERMDKHK